MPCEALLPNRPELRPSLARIVRISSAATNPQCLHVNRRAEDRCSASRWEKSGRRSDEDHLRAGGSENDSRKRFASLATVGFAAKAGLAEIGVDQRMFERRSHHWLRDCAVGTRGAPQDH
jgi:hypothetical protein